MFNYFLASSLNGAKKFYIKNMSQKCTYDSVLIISNCKKTLGIGGNIIEGWSYYAMVPQEDKVVMLLKRQHLSYSLKPANGPTEYP
jgi:hypothetical protein